VQKSKSNFKPNRFTKNLIYWLSIALLLAGAIWQFINVGGDTARGYIEKVLYALFLPTMLFLLAWKLEWLEKKFFPIVVFLVFLYIADDLSQGYVVTKENLPLLLSLFALVLLISFGKAKKSELYGQTNGYYGNSRKRRSNKNDRSKQLKEKDSIKNTNENI